MKNHLRLILTTLIFGLSINGLYAQFIIKESYFETTGVSNTGDVSGYETWAGPYFLWNPDHGAYTEIGGAAPGNGVGGRARFSDDGNYISGTSYVEVPVPTNWERTVLSDFNYIFKGIEFPAGQKDFGYAVGQSLTYNGNGIVLRTTDGGASWSPMWVDNQHRGLEAESFPTTYTGYVGGWNRYFAKTTNSGWDWQVLNPGGLDNVYIYTSIEFKDELNGIVTAQLDNGYAVYITSDGGATWSTGSGVAGIPSKVVYAGGNTYYLSTTNGRVQKSVNNGLTWTTKLTYPSVYFLGLNFYNELTGYVLAETYISKTTDGGATWVESPVIPGVTDGVLWRDIEWLSPNELIITGTPDMICESHNGGASWTWANQAIFNGEPALYDISATDVAVMICGSQGNFYKKSLISSIDIAEMSRYNKTTQQWSSLGSLGNVVDNSTSSGYCISGNGNTVVGNSWVTSPNVHAHAVAWNETDGVVDLGTLYPGRSTRADAVNFDGSVIVGYQDFNGPWKSAVWRKNPSGGYFPNQHLLIDPNGNPDDEMNQLGQATAVSADGNWIGGYGDFAFNNPWIWSEATGVIDLGSIGMPEGTIGYVSGMNHDASIVVGWYEYSPDPWSQEYAPFIWTPELGSQNLNTFITETLGFTMQMGPVWSVTSISENGRYITGWGVDPNVGPWGETFCFRLELSDWLGLKKTAETENVRIYPNPFMDKFNIHSNETLQKVDILDVSGRLVKTISSRDKDISVDMSHFNGGVYFVNTLSGSTTRTYKVVKE